MIRSTALAALLLALPGGAHAQVRRGQTERSTDRRELRQDRREHADDRRDLERLEALLARFDDARRARDPRGISAVVEEVRAEVEVELRESRHEHARDRAEIRRDVRELRTERREVGRDLSAGDVREARADARDARDDRRDLADDRRDAARERETASRRRAIADELTSLRSRNGQLATARKRALLVELVDLARAELGDDRRERRDDLRGAPVPTRARAGAW